MTPIDIEWYDAHPYPPPGWSLSLGWNLARISSVKTDGAVVVAVRGSDEITWTWEEGASLAHGGWHGVSGTKVKVDPCVAQTLRLYALGLRRPVAEEGKP